MYILLVFILDIPKHLEKLILVFILDTSSSVNYRDLQKLVVLTVIDPRFNYDTSSLSKLQSIRLQVKYYLLNPLLIMYDLCVHQPLQISFKSDSFFRCLYFLDVYHFFDALFQVKFRNVLPEFIVSNLRIIQEVLNLEGNHFCG